MAESHEMALSGGCKAIKLCNGLLNPDEGGSQDDENCDSAADASNTMLEAYHHDIDHSSTNPSHPHSLKCAMRRL